MNKRLIPIAVASLALITACEPKGNSGSSATTSAVKKEDAIASVNGQYISKKTLADLEKDIAQRSQGQSPNYPKEKLVEELVQRELLVQDAIQKKLDQSPDTLAQLEGARKAILTQASLQNYLKTNPISDAEIKAEYDKQIGGTGTEYKASHILVKTEDEAKKLIAELDKGGKFAKLANKHSLDAKESQNGGDLGWFNPGQMVAPFSEAAAKLEKGKYTKVPVKTQFGWHIIWLEDSRKQTPPPLDAVKEQLTPMLQRQKIQALIDNLKKQAKVEMLLPKEEPKPVTPPSISATPATPGAPPAPGAAPADAPKEAAKTEEPKAAAEPAKK
jgi:peptidyl-prolyl cis-trans isomerase C